MPLSNEVLTALAIERIEAVAEDRHESEYRRVLNLEEIKKVINRYIDDLKKRD